MPSTAALTMNYRDFLVLLPEVTLAFWGLIVLAADLGFWRARPDDVRLRRLGVLTLIGCAVALAAAALPLLSRFAILDPSTCPLVNDYSSNPDPLVFFGTIADDLLTQLFNLLLIVMFALVVRMSMSWQFTTSWGEYYALLCWSTVGMMLLLASEDLITLFITLETMTICLYLATGIEKNRLRSSEGAFKYFVYGSVSSALFLFGLSLVYGLTGTTRFGAIREILAPIVEPDRLLHATHMTVIGEGLAGQVAGATAVLLLMAGFGFKIAAVPFHQWAPDAYEGAPAPVTAWLAAGSKIASMIALMKVLLGALGPWSASAASVLSPGWIGVVVVLSSLSMTYGNFAALAQRNFKRMLAYSSIAHAGYMLIGVAAAGLSTRRYESAGSVLFYLIVYGFTNIGAFAVASWLARDLGSDDIDDLGGVGRAYPFLAVCIVLMMLSLIGMPPFGGFFGKLYMFMEALSQPGDQVSRLTLIWLVALGLFNSVVSAFYYVRVLKAMFLRGPTRGTLKPASSAIVLPILVGTFVVVATGLNPRPLVEFAKDAAVPMLSDGGSTAARTASTPPRVVPIAPPPAPLPSKTVATAAEVAARVE